MNQLCWLKNNTYGRLPAVRKYLPDPILATKVFLIGADVALLLTPCAPLAALGVIGKFICVHKVGCEVAGLIGLAGAEVMDRNHRQHNNARITALEKKMASR